MSKNWYWDKYWRIILQNNATKEIHSFPRQINYSASDLFLLFKLYRVAELPDGEYTYYCFRDYNDTDVEVEENFNNGGSVILDNEIVIHLGEVDEVVKIRDLNPFVGLLRIGDVDVTSNQYDDEKNKKYYYEG